MSTFWDDLWEREKEFTQERGKKLRHDTRFVAVSTIAGQFYCEYKVENEFAFGEVPTEAKGQGLTCTTSSSRKSPSRRGSSPSSSAGRSRATRC